MTHKKSIILLSGGLDSTVLAGVSKDEYNIELALTFDYGQKAAKQELEAAIHIADYYNIKHQIIKLPFLKEITKTSPVSNDDIPKDNLGTLNSAKLVWIPNRNGLFLNIAAAFADSCGYTHILFGANKEEGETFPDNTKEFTDALTKSFEFSTLVKVKAAAPLINYNKNDIVSLAIKHSVPLEMVWSCYGGGEKNCGICESCIRLKSALVYNNAQEYMERLF